jgi:hypothetical protein
MEAWQRREVANGARTKELIAAVSWCMEPAIRVAVRSIFERTGDVDILLAALPGIDKTDEKLILTRIDAYVKKLPKDEDGAYGDGYNLLVAAGKRLGATGKPLYLQYLKGAGSMRCYTMCEVLRHTHKEWAIELLGPLLDDKRAIEGYSHLASKDDSENSVPIRVCDAAAETLSRHYPELKFEMIGTANGLDGQIKIIRAELKRKMR